MRRCQILVWAMVCWVAAGCAGYADHVRGMRSSLNAGSINGALTEVGGALEVEHPDDYPLAIADETVLLLLERGMIKHGLRQYGSSSRDFRVADRALEVVDLRNDTLDNIAKYLFTDDAGPYKAPPYEKLLLNSMGMINYLALGDLESSRVEARRFTVMRKFYDDTEVEIPAIGGLGSYLAGLTYELSGRYEDALRYYDEAASAEGESVAGTDLGAQVQRLLPCSSYEPKHIVFEKADSQPVAPGVCESLPPGHGMLVVVSHNGLAPYKEPKRIPIGAALLIAQAAVYGSGLNASTQAQANEMVAKGLLTWVNFPELQRNANQYQRVATYVDDKPLTSAYTADVESQVLSGWEQIQGLLMVAAITRLVTRIVLAETTEAAIEAGGGDSLFALLAGLAVRGGMTAADVPDTRSWVTLPAKVVISRTIVPAGVHNVTVDYIGPGGNSKVQIPAIVPDGGYALVSAASMR